MEPENSFNPLKYDYILRIHWNSITGDRYYAVRADSVAQAEGEETSQEK